MTGVQTCALPISLNRLEQKRLNDLVFVQYNLRLKRNQLMNKRPDTDPIVLDDIDPNLEWVVETQPPKFGDDIDVELEDLLEILLDADPLLSMASIHTGVDPEIAYMVGTSQPGPRSYSRRRRRHSTNTTTSVVDDFDLEEPETCFCNCNFERYFVVYYHCILLYSR